MVTMKDRTFEWFCLFCIHGSCEGKEELQTDERSHALGGQRKKNGGKSKE